MPEKMRARATGAALDLVGIEGPGEGLHVPLDPDEPLLIGRGLRGLEVPDPHVSLQHARIEWRDDHYVVRDLDSATGTEVNGHKLAPDRPVALEIDTEITVGRSVFKVVERHARWRRAAEITAVLALVFSLVSAVAWFLAPRRDVGVSLVWGDAIAQGSEQAAELRLDLPYLRRRGLDARKLQIRRVTDADQDGIDEVWLASADAEYVITFEPSGRWVELGELPRGCVDLRDSGGVGMPMLECGSVTWAILDAGRYQPLAQEGVVLWGVPEDAWTGPGIAPSSKVKPYRAALRREEALAGFLAANGIDQPVHYIVCETAFDKVRPVALLQNGELRELTRGCGQSIQVGGVELVGVRAVAFTAGGHAALVRDVEVFLSGGTDGIFRAPELDEFSVAWSSRPEVMSARFVTFDGQDHYFEPVAAESGIPGVRSLPHDRKKKLPPPRSQTATIVGTGVVQIDPPGCALLEAQTEPWTCPLAQGCLSSSTFLTLRSVGCDEGAVVEGTYAGGDRDLDVGDLQLRLRIESVDRDNLIEVTRAQVAWRERRAD